jgi:hypothetical protein
MARRLQPQPGKPGPRPGRRQRLKRDRLEQRTIDRQARHEDTPTGGEDDDEEARP